MRFDKEDQEKKNLTYNAEYLEATGGSKYTSSPAEALAHQQQKWNRWEQHLAAKRLPLLDEAAGIVRPAEGQPGFDPVAFGRDQQARRDNHRRALQDCIDRARMALSADTDSSPSTLASLSGKLRSFTLTENPDRLPQDALVNDLREELAVAEKLLLELTPAGLDAEVLARDDEPTMHALRAAAERGF
jgi:hypothetical protein